MDTGKEDELIAFRSVFKEIYSKDIGKKVHSSYVIKAKKANTMRECLDGAGKEQEDNSKWLSLIRQYADIKELDREMLHLLIKEIVVHEDMAEGKRNTTVEIHFNFKKQGSQLTVKS